MAAVKNAFATIYCIVLSDNTAFKPWIFISFPILEDTNLFGKAPVGAVKSCSAFLYVVKIAYYAIINSLPRNDERYPRRISKDVFCAQLSISLF